MSDVPDASGSDKSSEPSAAPAEKSSVQGNLADPAVTASAATDPAVTAAAERFQEVDLDTIELVRPRSVGVEHATLSVMRECGFEEKLQELGLNRPQIAAVLGNIVARIAHPASELATHAWLQKSSSLGELQRRVTLTMKRRDGRTVHVRKATRPEPRHHELSKILGLQPNPGGTQRTLV